MSVLGKEILCEVIGTENRTKKGQEVFNKNTKRRHKLIESSFSVTSFFNLLLKQGVIFVQTLRYLKPLLFDIFIFELLKQPLTWVY